MKIDRDSPGVRVPPPLIALAFILSGVGLQWVHPLYFLQQPLRVILSVLFIGGGLAMVIICAVRFKKAQTGIRPWEPTIRVITNGLYRFSRNPIYCGFILVGLGVACAVNSLWIAFLQAPLIFVLDRFVIWKEERYLEGKFGEEYRAFKRKVRRWI